MFVIIALTVLVLTGVGSTIAALRNDGYRRTPTDWNQVP